jgi:hypothetical protein
MVVLEEHLQRCLTEMRAVYVVQGIFGSTEMGAVDPIGKILELRSKYEALGLSFLVNADVSNEAIVGNRAEILPGRVGRLLYVYYCAISSRPR